METIKFVCDVMLKNLTRWLRMFNVNALYPPSESDEDVVSFAVQHSAVVLTKDKELCKRRAVIGKCYIIKSENLDDMLKEVFEKFLLPAPKTFTPKLCPLCNGELYRIGIDEIESNKNKIPPKVIKNSERFWRCGSCGQVFWEGTHWNEINNRLERLKKKIKN
ncbi:Mut7-C RNAse domain-containing protein [Candidatus Micrarchaeota archaeon]|nr:Mut7-C RNAse domain-containing protein [Candidatus Micrarchaeota archaeon]